MKRMFLLLAITIVLLNSCAPYVKPKTYSFPKEKEFNVGKDIVWAKTMEFLLKNKILPKSTDKASGIIKYEGDLIDYQGLYKNSWSGDSLIKPMFDCGLAGINRIKRQYSDGEIFIMIYEVETNKSKIQIECKNSNKNNLNRDEYCVSTGIFEKELIEFISNNASSKEENTLNKK
jgi:hypothetical protein